MFAAGCVGNRFFLISRRTTCDRPSVESKFAMPRKRKTSQHAAHEADVQCNDYKQKRRCDPLASKMAQELAGSLRIWSWVVAGINIASFIALLVITLTVLTPVPVPLWVDFGGVISSIGSYPLSGTLLPFPLITGLFHVAQALNIFDYYRYALIKGVTTHRWVEYGITNSLISVSIFALSGVGNILLLVGSVLVNISMQYFGYLHERANSNRQKTLSILWWGFVPWLWLWFIPLTYYFVQASSLPTYVGVAIIGSFVLSIVFTLPLFWRYTTDQSELYANYMVERNYLILSVTAKLFLDWTVVIGVLLQ